MILLLYGYTIDITTVTSQRCPSFPRLFASSSVFAYGQTSTGKTHTMQGTEEQPGVIPLAIEECFSYVSTSNDDRLAL